MKQANRCMFSDCRNAGDAAFSRRTALGSSVVALLGLLSGSALAGERNRSADGRAAEAAVPERMRRRIEESEAYAERMRNAGPDERLQIMRQRVATRHQQAIEDLKEQLGISDKEWAVIKPRLEAVYNLVHPLPQVGGGAASSRSELELKKQELRELLNDNAAGVDQIKAKLTAVRAAKEKANQELATARQNLRQLMTIRQEALLVLDGLLD
ncbi:MAG: hypothetical protein JW955_15360 [Sedimentisphaerales bacterium]|nr:hypothetical protein [Sedimentisphaerales bacterium]